MSSSSSPVVFWVILLVVGMCLSSRVAGADAKENAESAPAESVAAETEKPLLEAAKILPGVVITVEVLASGDPEVPSSSKRVSDNGTIDMPLIGTVSVEGMTLHQLRDFLAEKYLKYLRKPQVIAAFDLSDRPDAISPFGHITILGRVSKPGRVNIPPTRDLTITRAIQQVGGFASSARENAIKITRKTQEGGTRQFEVDLKSIGAKGNIEDDVLLQAGDVVYVPEQIW